MRAAGLATVLVAVGLGVAACGAGSPSAGPPSSPVASSGRSSSAAGGGTTVTVSETEYHLALSTTSVPAGRVTFSVRNDGHTTHALTVKTATVSASTDDLGPGQSTSLTITLPAGATDVFCPVADHKMLGMDVTVTAS